MRIEKTQSIGETTTENLAKAEEYGIPVRRFALEVVDTTEPMIFESEGERTVVGTHRRANVRLPDGAVSRFHFEIIVRGGSARLVDLSSRNGTYLDGVRVYDAELPAHALIAVGRTHIRFKLLADHATIPMSRGESFGSLIGGSHEMRAAFAALRSAAASDHPLVIEGERGVGKSIAAEAVHDESPRCTKSLVVVDCAGNFDPGRLSLNDGGTLVLRRVDLLTRAAQRALVPLLRRNDPNRPRVVATTEEHLGLALNAGRIDGDFFDALTAIIVRIPPLRERTGDIALLVQHYLRQEGAEEAAASQALLSADTLADLASRPWPGNGSSLRNYVIRSIATGEVIEPDEAGEALPEIDLGQRLRDGRQRWIEYFERQYLRGALEAAGGNVSRAARIAGIDRVHMYRLLAKNKLRS